MKEIRIEEISDIEKKIFITVGSDKVNKKFDEFFENMKKEAHIPGFRKGKAPVNILKNKYRNDAKNAISQVLISEYYQSALKDFNINPVGNPKIDAEADVNNNINKKHKYQGSFNKDNSYAVEINIDVLPILDPSNYSNIQLEYKNHDINELIESKLLDYQNQFAEREQIKDSGSMKGDSVVIDYEGFLNSKIFDKKEDLPIVELGSGTLFSDFEDQLVGLIDGESKKIKVSFPKDYSIEIIAGETVEFNIKMKSVIRKTPAKLDNDLSMMAGFQSIDELKEFVANAADKEMENIKVKNLENTIVNNLLENNKFNVPESLIKNEENRILQHNKMDDLSKEIISKIKQAASNNVNKAIILDAIFEKENLELAPDDLKCYLDIEAKNSNITRDELVSRLYNTNKMDDFVAIIKNKKVIEYLININMKEGNNE